MVTLEDLNDDCLYILFKSLDVSSQYNLACVCKRFQRIFQSVAKTSYRRIDLKTLNAIKRDNEVHFFRLIGAHVKIWDGVFSVVKMEVVAKFCTNLEAIRLDYCNNWQMKYIDNLLKMKSLKTVYIYSSTCRDNTVERLTSKLQNLPKLTHLSLNTYQHIGDNLHLLYGLKTLDLNIDKSIDPDYFLSCCRNLRQLERLELKRFTASNFTTQTYIDMVKYCPYVESLLLTVYESKASYEHVAKLPSLKYFILNCLELRHKLIENLVEYKAHTLLLLKIPLLKIELEVAKKIGRLTALRELQCWPVNEKCYQYFCTLKNLEILNLQFSKITNENLLMLLKSCPKIRFVDLYHCFFISPDIIPPVVKLLQERFYFKENYFRFPLELSIRETKITLDTLKEPEVIEAKHLLNLSMQRKMNYSLKFARIFEYCYEME